MLRRILENTEGVDLYAITGLIIFLLSFIAIVIWMIKADKKYIRRMKNLPLEDDSEPKQNTTGEDNEIK